MLLIWVLFLATAVEALPGGGGRQLGKGPRAHRQARRAICKTACQNKTGNKPKKYFPRCICNWA